MREAGVGTGSSRAEPQPSTFPPGAAGWGWGWGVTAKTWWERGMERRTRGGWVAAGSVPVPRVLSSHGDPHDAIVTVVPASGGRMDPSGSCKPGRELRKLVPSRFRGWHLHPRGGICTPRWHPAPQGTWKHKASREPRRAQTPVPWGQRCWGARGGPECSGMTKPLASGTKEVPWPRAAPRPPGSLRQSQTAPDQPQNAWHRCCSRAETP